MFGGIDLGMLGVQPFWPPQDDHQPTASYHYSAARLFNLTIYIYIYIYTNVHLLVSELGHVILDHYHLTTNPFRSLHNHRTPITEVPE